MPRGGCCGIAKVCLQSRPKTPTSVILISALTAALLTTLFFADNGSVGDRSFLSFHSPHSTQLYTTYLNR
ncbi:hypothetical protein GE21DRAFT_1284061 [Neurospora crassa]|nr:hypothetical protein GE21DRAFT_1284061 [Neurospora crassa]